MENKSSENAKPKTKKVRFNLYAPGAERVSLAGDFNGCLLVIPEVFRTHEHITLYQGRLPKYHH
jgi:1,4-alpha-glucan branching enzyme